jgi:hypothetical protein
LRKYMANSQLSSGPMWASAPTKLWRIRIALQISNARRFYRSHSKAAAIKLGVP